MNRCRYVFKKGINKGSTCREVCPNGQSYCRKHIPTEQQPVLRLNSSPPMTKQAQEEFYLQRIMALETTDQNKSVIIKHLNNMKRLDATSVEYYKNQVFVDTCLSYPWTKSFEIKKVVKEVGVTEFLNYIKSQLDKHIFGMDSVKNEIMNVVCKFITNPASNRNNMALYGPAGVAKSKFIKVLADTLGVPLKTISLGGIKDSSFFLGHGYVYVESGPGKILQNVIDSGISNPIMYFDELDKVSESTNGKDIYSFLSYLTDPTQNKEFSDHYFYGMSFDLSRVFYVFTFNDISKVDKILLDRLNIIQVGCHNLDEICHILETHCIPEIQANIGLPIRILFENHHYHEIFHHCDKYIDKKQSSGIREYYRVLEKIYLEINKHILLEEFPIEHNKESSTLVLDDVTFEMYFNIVKKQLIQDDDGLQDTFLPMYS